MWRNQPKKKYTENGGVAKIKLGVASS